MTQPHHSRRRRILLGGIAVVLVGVLVGSLAIATDTLGAGHRWESVLARVDRFLAGPVPDRAAPVTVLVTEPPVLDPTAAPIESPVLDPTAAPIESPFPSARPTIGVATGSPAVSATPTAPPTPTPSPQPAREPVDIQIATDPEAVFAHQVNKDWCAVAGTQMVLAQLGLVDTSNGTQKEIGGRIREWESKADSRNGDWGPAAMALALDAYGAPGYEVRAFETRQGALRNAARTIQSTGAPVILLAWRGAHTWVMTGFRADADPSVFRDAHIEGAYIQDPWYPWVSSIWGPSDPPGTFQDEAEMVRNFLKWRRPEGHYPDRDGLYITVAPTIPVSATD